MRRALEPLVAYRGKSSGRADLVLGIVAFIGFLAVWYLVVLIEVVPQRFLPLPEQVVGALWHML